MTLYGGAKAPGDPLREAGTTVVALTDSSTGTANEELLPVVSGGSGATAGAFNDATTRDAAITIINNNFADLAAKIAALITHLNDGR